MLYKILAHIMYYWTSVGNLYNRGDVDVTDSSSHSTTSVQGRKSVHFEAPAEGLVWLLLYMPNFAGKVKDKLHIDLWPGSVPALSARACPSVSLVYLSCSPGTSADFNNESFTSPQSKKKRVYSISFNDFKIKTV